MLEVKPSDKFLSSKQEIKTYLRNCSDYMFGKYIKAGMPARWEDGRWSAHADNIDEWWKLYTRVSMKNIIDKISDNGDQNNL
jgi:hypothetical protein